jgi:hypothetical protein
MVVLALALSFALSEVTYQLIEQRISKNHLPLVISEDMMAYGGVERVLSLIPAFFVVASLLTAGIGLAIVPDEAAVPEDAIKSTGAGAAEAMDLSNRKNSSSSDSTKRDSSSSDSSSSSSSEDSKSDSSSSSSSSSTNDIPTGSIVLEASSKDVKEGIYSPVIIADSVAGDADWYFKDHTPDALLDSYIGRRPDQALEVLKGYLDQNVVGNIVVLDSFSNVPATDATMKKLIEACGKRRVYLVNVRIPEVEQEQINKQIARFAKDYDNVTLIDWYSYSEGHDDWIYPDGEHLTPEGQPYYVDMITNAIAKDFVEDGGTAKAAK